MKTPHTVEALIVRESQLWPRHLEPLVPMQQGTVMIGADVMHIFHHKMRFAGLCDLI